MQKKKESALIGTPGNFWPSSNSLSQTNSNLTCYNSRFCSGDGQYHSPKNKLDPRDFLTVNLVEIEGRVIGPSETDKEKAPWVIFSTLLSRVHAEQRQKGKFGAAWLDIDKNKMGFENVVQTIRRNISGIKFIAYTTKSATEENQKCRIIIPYADLIGGEDHERIQKILNDRLQKAEIEPDRKNETAGQICYLPNRGKYYRHHIEKGQPLEPFRIFALDIEAEREREKAEKESLAARQEEAKRKAAERAAKGAQSPIDAYNNTFPVEDCLLVYGYKQCGQRYLSPLSQSGSPGVTVKDGRWISSHESDRIINYSGSGDAFDLYKYFEHGGEEKAALRAAAEMFLNFRGNFLNSKSPSLSSSSSLSISYPSSCSSLNEEILHFKNELVKRDGESKPKLVPQSIAALKVGSKLVGQNAFCIESCTWYRFTGDHWKKISEREADAKVTELIYEGTGEVGFTNFYEKGVFELLKKFPETKLPGVVPGTIPFRNGLLDVKTKKLTTVDYRNAATWVLPYDYSADAQCPRFHKWLYSSVDGDTETIQVIRAWINATLIGRAYLQVFMHFFGPAGTGKSTFGRLMFKLVGEANATTTTLKQLEQNRFEAASIHGKRLVAIEEADKYGGSVSVLKAMTGQDPLRLERKNKQQQGSFIFEGQTFIMSNERFITSDKTSGIERRRITVEFTHRIPRADRKAWDLEGGEDKILYPEIPGIIAWALDLTEEEVAKTFENLPLRIAQSNLEAARENNPLLDWMLCNVIADNDSATQIGNKQETRINGEITYADSDTRLYPNYLAWCRENGRESLCLQRFASVLIDNAASYGAKISKKREANGTKILGLRLRRNIEKSWLDKLENVEGEEKNEEEMKDKYLKMQKMKKVKDFGKLHTKKAICKKTVEVMI